MRNESLQKELAADLKSVEQMLISVRSSLYCELDTVLPERLEQEVPFSLSWLRKGGQASSVEYWSVPALVRVSTKRIPC
jgi:hypothetical protein